MIRYKQKAVFSYLDVFQCYKLENIFISVNQRENVQNISDKVPK